MPKQLFISGGAVLILLGIVLVPRFNKPKSIDNYFADSSHGFCINIICLAQSNSNWWVKNGNSQAPADSDKVDTVQKSLRTLKLEDLVSRNSELAASMGFSDSSQTVIEVGDRKLEIGAIGPNYTSTFVRQPGTKEIYSVPFIFDKTDLSFMENWLNRRVTNWPLYQIKKINGISPDKDGKWLNDKWVEGIVHLEADSYDPVKYELKGAIEYSVEMENGKGNLWIGKSGAGKNIVYWASTDQNIFYKIKKTDFDLLTSVH